MPRCIVSPQFFPKKAHVVSQNALQTLHGSCIHPCHLRDPSTEDTLGPQETPISSATDTYLNRKNRECLGTHQHRRILTESFFFLDPIMSPVAPGNTRELEKKRSAIRTQLRRIRDSGFRRDCREFIRAIRYLRLRNDEVRTLDFLSRLQTALNRASNDAQMNRLTLAVPQQQQRRRMRRAPGSKAISSRNKKRSPPR